MDIKLFNESCYDVLKKLEPNSIDMVLTDPPYGNMNGFNGIELNKEYFNIAEERINGVLL